MGKEHFQFAGKKVEDNILFVWSIVAISRALRFKAEAQCTQASSNTLAAIAAYYSIFHLGVFLVYSAPHLIPPELKGRINKKLDDGRQDPREGVRHPDVEQFLTAAHRSHGLPESMADLFKKSQALRVFANYGPDLRYIPRKNFQVFNLEHHPEKVSEVLGKLEDAFSDAVTWASRNGPDDTSYVSIALSMAAPYFTPNSDGKPYYSGWSSDDVLSSAERLRAQLEQAAHQIIYQGSAPNTGLNRTDTAL